MPKKELRSKQFKPQLDKNPQLRQNSESTKITLNMETTKKSVPLTAVRNLVLIFCLLALTGWGGWFVGRYNITSVKDIIPGLKQEIVEQKVTVDRSQPSDKLVDMSLFWRVWDQLEQNYLFKDKIDYEKMVHGAIKGMTSALEDPYTAYFPPRQNQTSKENLNGSFEGVGIQLGYKMGDQMVVIAPISGMPAEKAGVKAGDLILKIKDEGKGLEKETYGMSLAEAVEHIRGEKGTIVTLTLLHDGATETYEVDLVRETILVPSVEVAFGRLEEGKFTEASDSGQLVAHLRLSRFGELTEEQWDKAVEEITKRGSQVSGVVLDLRNNPGGYMESAVNLAAEFLPLGQVVVKQEHSKLPTQEFKTQRYGRLLTTPLVVLVNKGSASASEILAGALRDHGRTQIVGEQSFGKGTIQSVVDYDDGSGVHITIARWLTPKGEWVHEKGLTPDVEVKLDEEDPTNDIQLNKAVELLMQ
ncbi:MAG: S41 family peptidase [Patescibacteria group bacterium]|jgi:carboxyl-terminal processing protease